MADTYTKEDVVDTHDKDVPITRSWSQDNTEKFTIRDLEKKIVALTERIEAFTAEKTACQTKIDEAKKVLAG
jgi:hypothetical protein